MPLEERRHLRIADEVAAFGLSDALFDRGALLGAQTVRALMPIRDLDDRAHDLGLGFR
jgi:hypothetical protein